LSEHHQAATKRECELLVDVLGNASPPHLSGGLDFIKESVGQAIDLVLPRYLVGVELLFYSDGLELQGSG